MLDTGIHSILCKTVWIPDQVRDDYLNVVTGHWSLVTGHWSLVTGHWSLVTGHWSLVTGHSALVPFFPFPF
ncbi:MAG: hypothetical protein C1941_08360 [Prosthecochloris sp.]|nr:hypothetical protein [Prosthecochloris sp.]